MFIMFIIILSLLTYASSFTNEKLVIGSNFHRPSHLQSKISSARLLPCEFEENEESNPSYKIKTSTSKISPFIQSPITRRRLFKSTLKSTASGVAAIATGLSVDSPPLANAVGLVMFPCAYTLQNTYHFLRSGESLLEAENILSTNPLFGTNRENALSERGIDQVRQACLTLKESGVIPTFVRYSLQANSLDSANIVGQLLKVGRDRLVPEFNFMDPRAVGGWDMSSLDATEAAIFALDNDEAGISGMAGRPPPNEDGTPNETLADQVVRLQQLLSVLETQYSGDTILLIFPDGTGPALLSALIGGIPLNRVHELQLKPGELRLNVTYFSMKEKLPLVPSEEYVQILDKGREQLKLMRENPDRNWNVKDKREEEVRLRDEERRIVENEMKKKEEKEKKEAVLAERQKLVVEGQDRVWDESQGGVYASAVATIAGGLITAGLWQRGKDGGNDEIDVARDDAKQVNDTIKALQNRTLEVSVSPTLISSIAKGGESLLEPLPLETSLVMKEEQLGSRSQVADEILLDDLDEAWLAMMSDLADEKKTDDLNK